MKKTLVFGLGYQFYKMKDYIYKNYSICGLRVGNKWSVFF